MVHTPVLIADDHPLFRSAMCQALTEVVGNRLFEASSFSETLEQLHSQRDIELVFLDLNMPGNEGLAGLTEIQSLFPDVLVVIVSAQEEPAIIQKAITLGASGFIPKSASIACISQAVTQVLDGEQWLPDNMAETIANLPPQDDVTERLAQLTPHQFKVLKMVADGLLNKQIAHELDISESTVKQHVSAVLKKLNVINRTKAGVAFKHAMGMH